MGPLKQSLVENISLQRCNCNIFGLTDTVALFAKEAGFFRFRDVAFPARQTRGVAYLGSPGQPQ